MSGKHPTASTITVVEKMGTRIVALLLLIAAASFVVLWTVNPVGSGSETTFALFVAIDLTSVAMISYVQRSISFDDRFGRAPLLAGCFFILFLILAGFYLMK
jgi:hypothetical protein